MIFDEPGIERKAREGDRRLCFAYSPKNSHDAAYAEFSERLRKLGFQEDAREGAPLCRWRQQTTTLDVMPLDEEILGFSNTWYRPAMDRAEERELEKG